METIIEQCLFFLIFSLFYLPSQRKKNTQKSGFWSNVSTNIVKDIRELSSYSMSSQSNRSEPAPDPLFSPFLCNVPLSDPKYSRKDTTSYIAATNDLERYASSMLQHYIFRPIKLRSAQPDIILIIFCVLDSLCIISPRYHDVSVYEFNIQSCIFLHQQLSHFSYEKSPL